MRIPIITTLGTLDVEIHFMPADPDSGFPEPYVDEMFLYYAKSDLTITDEDYASLSPLELHAIKQEYIRELDEQAAIARSYNKRESLRELVERQEHKYDG